MQTIHYRLTGENFPPPIPEACPFCGEHAVTPLPPKLRALQPDGTTHVCNPGLGGCNQGFEMEGSS